MSLILVIECRAVDFLRWSVKTRDLREKGLERARTIRVRLGRYAKQYDCPLAIHQICSEFRVPPLTGNSHWLNCDIICHHVFIAPHQKCVNLNGKHRR